MDRLKDIDPAADLDAFTALNREKSVLEDPVDMFRRYQKLEMELIELVEMKESDDESMKDLIEKEIAGVKDRMEKLGEDITSYFCKDSCDDQRDVMLEVRAGIGGDEAGIWVGDMIDMYLKYCDICQWKATIVSVIEF